MNTYSNKIIKMTSLIGLLVALSMLAAACASTSSVTTPGAYGSGSSNPGAASTSAVGATTPMTTTAPSGSSSEAEIKVATTSLGQILVNGNGMTLYAFTKDTPDTSNCTGNCLTIWPPLVTQGNPKVDTGVDQSMIGSAKLADGRMVVTYNNMPLYTYSKDTNPGDTNGQGVGSVWFVVSPAGKLIGQ